MLKTKSIRNVSLRMKLGLFTLLTSIIITGFNGCGGGGGGGSSSGSSAKVPSVTTSPATEVTDISATLNGTVNPNGLSITRYFQWGVSSSYGNTTPFQSISASSGIINISYPLSGLVQETTYHFRAVINVPSLGQTLRGADVTFTTSPPLTSPAQVTSPSPADGAINLAVNNTLLSWVSASNATSFDVCFGTATTPPLVVNTTQTNYNPGTLAYGTTYYWRIDPKNSAGTTTGIVWSFSTKVAPPPPAQVTTPNPAHTSTNMPITSTLSWASAADATSYGVYFGTNATPPFVITTTGTSYNPNTLLYSTTYYWRIDSANELYTTPGEIWNFTTIDEPVLPPAQVTTPNPADGATNVSITAQLSWAPAANTTSYDVCFGITNTNLTPLINTILTTYDPLTLTYNTTYYWRIDSKNSTLTTTGVVWSFTTGAQGGWTQVSCGLAHTVAIRNDGTLWAWGDNRYGQLGLGDYISRTSPTQVLTDTNWSSVSCGGVNYSGGGAPAHTLALKNDGTLWAWGLNNNGQLGLGDYVTRTTPTLVNSSSWRAIAAGGWHSLAILWDNSLWAWGNSYQGQVGLGSQSFTPWPYPITSAGTSWNAIAAGAVHSLAIRDDNTLWAWGYN
ncbi:MAG: hypothetical protein V1709_11095, partial [Planctomycetota bacterium]